MGGSTNHQLAIDEPPLSFKVFLQGMKGGQIFHG